MLLAKPKKQTTKTKKQRPFLFRLKGRVKTTNWSQQDREHHGGHVLRYKATWLSANMETPSAAQQTHEQMSCSPSANFSLSQSPKWKQIMPTWVFKNIWVHQKKKKKGWTLRFKKLQFRPSLCSLQCLLSLALPTANWLSILCAVAGKVGVNKLIFSWKRCSNTHPYQLPHQHWQIPPNPDALNSQLLFLSFPISPRSSISSCSIPPRIYLSSLLQQHYPLEVILLLPEVSTKTFVFAEQCCKKMPGVPLRSVEVPS